MSTTSEYSSDAPTREAIDALTAPTVLEFGVSWCPHCQAAQPLIAAAFANHQGVSHLKVEDGSGRPLGRSFHVKLWPTLIFLEAGREVARLVRPEDVNAIEQALASIDSDGRA